MKLLVRSFNPYNYSQNIKGFGLYLAVRLVLTFMVQQLTVKEFHVASHNEQWTETKSVSMRIKGIMCEQGYAVIKNNINHY